MNMCLYFIDYFVFHLFIRLNQFLLCFVLSAEKCFMSLIAKNCAYSNFDQGHF